MPQQLQREPADRGRHEVHGIVRRPAGASAPLTAAQEMFLFSHRWGATGAVDHVPIVIRREGALDAAALERALAQLATRHEILRSRVQLENDSAVQVVDDTATIALEREDFRADADPMASARSWIDSLIGRPFDLAAAPLLRAGAATLADRAYLVALVAHHIIVDAWSTTILRRELGVLYEAECAGQAAVLPPLEVQYGDYAVWERAWTGSRDYRDQMAFWRTRLAGAPTVQIEADAPRPTIQSFRGDALPIEVPEHAARALYDGTRAARATTTMGLLAAFEILLSKYSGQNDVVLGMPAANRGRAELEGVVGLFVNPVVIRTTLSPAMTFRELVDRVREVCLDAYAHQQLPFLHLVRELHPSRESAYTPLFQAMFAVQPPMGGLLVAGAGQPVNVQLGGSRFDILLRMTESRVGIRGAFEYNRDLFTPSRIERIAADYLRILSSVAIHPDRPISRVDLESEDAIRVTPWPARVVEKSAAIASAISLPQRIEAQAAGTPSAAAVTCGAETWSYADLNAAANRLARVLRAGAIGVEQIVGVAVERSLSLIVAELGVLKSGAAFLPLDVALPPARLAMMLADAGAACVVTTRTAAAQLPSTLSAIVIDEPATMAALAAASGEDLNEDERPPVRPAQAAYVLYTSGSTGRPKGVVVSHRALTAFVDGLAAVVPLGSGDRHVAITNVMADVAVFDLLVPLSHGAQVIVARSDEVQSTSRLQRVVAGTNATSIHLTPTLARLCVREQPEMLDGLRLFVGGEPLDLDLAGRLRARGCELWNFYGPTETTIVCTVEQLARDEAPSRSSAQESTHEPLEGWVPIGRPLSSVSVHVLDQYLAPTPPGVTGELYVAGDLVARGYLHGAAITAARFVADPFSRTGARLYRTGDLVRIEGDGRLMFRGRADHQVKIHGNRVELQEIEATLRLHPAVEQAVVTLFTKDGEQMLAAYVQPRHADEGRGATAAEDGPTIAEIRAFLRERLPIAVVPSAILLLPALPLTANGKIDRRALPPPAPEAIVARAAVLTPVEEILCSLFADVLGLPDVGVHTDFFEARGHSLMAMRLIARIEQTFGVGLSVSDVFEAPTPAALAQRIDAGATSIARTLVRRERPARIPLSYGQERLWLIDRLAGGRSPDYNLVNVITWDGPIDRSAMQAALGAMIARHESLRTSFVERDGTPSQVIEPSTGATIRSVDLSGLDIRDRRRHVADEMSHERQTPFQLDRAPLVRFTLLRLTAERHLLLRCTHHIVCDGWSDAVFVRELRALYRAFAESRPDPLPPLPVQYADFAIWQREQATEAAIQARLDYWTRQLDGLPPALQFPTKRRRAREEATGGQVASRLAPHQVQALRRVCREQGATPYMALLAAFGTLLWRYTGQSDFAIGSPVAARRHPDLEPLIGFFVNTIVMRLRFDAATSFAALLARVRRDALDAYRHQDVPFDRLLDATVRQRIPGVSPLFQVWFGLINVPTDAVRPADHDGGAVTGAHLRSVMMGAPTARFDLELNAFEQIDADVVWLSWLYNRQRFAHRWIEALARHFARVLDAVTTDPLQPLSRIELLDAEERAQVLS